MSTLGRRLTVLERIAEEARRREVRELVASLPEAHDLTPAELEEATDEARRSFDEIEALKRQGLSERQIVRLEAQRIAERNGTTVDEVLREAGLDPAAYR
jgi:hypothetical protein